MKKILTILYITLLIGSPVQAQNTSTSNNPTGNNPLPQYNLLEPLPCIPSPAAKDAQGNTIAGSEVTCARTGATQSSINFKYYVQYLFNLLIALAAVASVFMIAYGGLQYMSTDSWGGKKEGLAKFKNAVLGLLLVLTSFIILRTIDPRLVEIPTTLVAPLSIKYESVSAGLFQQIERDAAYYRQQTNELASKKRQTSANISDLEQEIQDLNSRKGELVYEEGVSADDPRVKDIDQKTREVQTDIIALKGKFNLEDAQSDIVASIHQYTGSRDAQGNVTQAQLEDIRKGREAATKFYQDGLRDFDALETEYAVLNEKLEKENIFASHRKDLDATYYPIYGDLLLMENTLLSPTNPEKALGDIQQVEKVIIPKITDPQKRAALQQRYDQTAAMLTSRLAGKNASKNVIRTGY